MAWIEARQRSDGSTTYWIRDRRDGRQIVIATTARTRAEADLLLEQYVIRHELQKMEADHECDLLDRLWGAKKDAFQKAPQN